MSFINTAWFFYGYCAVVGPIMLGIGIFAQHTARKRR